jgi:hypothetical protein
LRLCVWEIRECKKKQTPLRRREVKLRGIYDFFLGAFLAFSLGLTELVYESKAFLSLNEARLFNPVHFASTIYELGKARHF